MSTVSYPHIEIRDNGTAYIQGTGFKVRMLVERHLATGADAAELRGDYPNLSLGQIYSALAYYHDHRPGIDGAIEQLTSAEPQLRGKLENRATTEKLRQAMKDS
jgi:uncharacterized protein (DUF433 family)